MRRIQIGDVGKKGTVWKQNHGSTNTTDIRKVVKEEGKGRRVVY